MKELDEVFRLVLSGFMFWGMGDRKIFVFMISFYKIFKIQVKLRVRAFVMVTTILFYVVVVS